MKNTVLKYVGIAWLTIIFFANFIACGSQMYQVSVREDFDDQRALESNPEAADPESTVYGIHATDGWKQLPIPYSFGEKLNKEQRTHLARAMHIWEVAVGKKLFAIKGVHTGVHGDKFEDLYSSLDDRVNGHYMDKDWAKTNKPDYVLATTIWHNASSPNEIAKADIRYNDAHYIIGDSLVQQSTEDKEVVDMQSLALHELGHLLGLAHVSEDVDPLSIMNPSLYIGEGLTSRVLSEGDVMRIQTIYGCSGKACDIGNVLARVGNMSEEKLTDPLSLAH